ncbi:hypothetical protein IG631_08898 [Alternaria alternata]|nr:hypothetical protein IG631_08898 [Alternaria alternata]
MATQHQTDSGSGIPAEDHKQSHSSVRLRCKVDLVSRTSERRFRETNDSLPGSLPRSTSSSHGHAPCLANAVWCIHLPRVHAYHSLSKSNALFPSQDSGATNGPAYCS